MEKWEIIESLGRCIMFASSGDRRALITELKQLMGRIS